MRVAIGIGSASTSGDSFGDVVEYAVEAERLGVDFAWSAEAWGSDAVAPLAFLAARTSRIRLGTGVMQITARAPAMMAMTAMTLSSLSGGRFLLGLGTSGPQVVEGLHGVPFKGSLGRLRECVDIARKAFAGERVVNEGPHYVLPRPGGEGKALKLAHAPDPRIPIYLASLAPKSLELLGEVADGWLGTSFIPEQAEVVFEPIRRGAERAGRDFAALDLQVGGPVWFGDDVERVMPARKRQLAFSLGAMGSRQTNFYNEAYRRAGYALAAAEVQDLWIAGKRAEAVERVPDDLVAKTSFIGTEDDVAARIRAYRTAGVTTLRVAPIGDTLGERIAILGRFVDLVRRVAAESDQRVGEGVTAHER